MDLVKMLEHQLEEAKKGRIAGHFIVVCSPEGMCQVFYGKSDGSKGYQDLLGFVEIGKLKFVEFICDQQKAPQQDPFFFPTSPTKH